MKSGSYLTYVCLALIISACRQRTPEPVAVVPKPPSVPAVNELEKDPAAFLEGVYTGGIYTRTATEIGLLGVATHLLVKRLSNYQVELFSVYGQMQSYQLNIETKGDTIQDVAGQALDLSMVVKNGKPVDFHVGVINPSLVDMERPQMAFFDWLDDTEYRPLAAYLSANSNKHTLTSITGVYCGLFPLKVDDARRYMQTAKAIVVRQAGEQNVEVFDINRWQKPLKFALTLSTKDSVWTGQSNEIQISFEVKSGRPQKVSIVPLVSDTVSAYVGWPPLNFAWDVAKPSYNHSYIPL